MLHQAKLSTFINRKETIFNYDNARLHISQQTQHKLMALKWEILLKPGYFPDLAPSSFYQFCAL